jgi:four helix bundle protein
MNYQKQKINNGYEDLIVWQKSMSLVEEVYKITKTFPKEELFGLVSQMRRSAVSVPSNIAEGYGRTSKGYFVSFLKISLGSLCELETQINISKKLGYLNQNQDTLRYLIIEIKKMIISLTKKNK